MGLYDQSLANKLLYNEKAKQYDMRKKLCLNKKIKIVIQGNRFGPKRIFFTKPGRAQNRWVAFPFDKGVFGKGVWLKHHN